MLVSYIGNFGPEYSTENDIRRAFTELGWEMNLLQENEVSSEQIYEAAKDSDLLLITGTWGRDAVDLDTFLDIIHDLAKKGIPSATLHLDTFWGTSRGGRRWWLEPMFHTSHLFTADGDYQTEWKLFGKKHTWLPPGIRHDAAHFGKPRKEYECDVAFVGSNGDGYHEDVWTYRKELVDHLRAMCKKNGWSWKNPGGDQPKIDRSDDMNDFYASAKVTVGDSLCINKENSEYWSDRVYEATGRGGLLVMPRITAIQKQFGMMPTYEWGDWDDLETVIKELLDDEVSRKLIQKECQEITAKNHTYVNRLKTMLKELGL